jgi:hypothetical protein
MNDDEAASFDIQMIIYTHEIEFSLSTFNDGQVMIEGDGHDKDDTSKPLCLDM